MLKAHNTFKTTNRHLTFVNSHFLNYCFHVSLEIHFQSLQLSQNMKVKITYTEFANEIAVDSTIGNVLFIFSFLSVCIFKFLILMVCQSYKLLKLCIFDEPVSSSFETGQLVKLSNLLLSLLRLFSQELLFYVVYFYHPRI